jgi:hypothetical protein
VLTNRVATRRPGERRLLAVCEQCDMATVKRGIKRLASSTFVNAEHPADPVSVVNRDKITYTITRRQAVSIRCP